MAELEQSNNIQYAADLDKGTIKSEVTATIEKAIVACASELHDAWREPRKQPDGTYEPRIKEVNGVQYDIANLSFAELPEKFQKENYEAAKGAVKAVYAISPTADLTTADIETVSDIIHQQWMERNGSWAPAEQMVPYNQLPEEEKAKDRAIALEAIKALKVD